MNRREANKGVGAFLVGLTAMSDRAQGMEPVAAEKYRQEKLVARLGATAMAFEVLKRIGHFTHQECEEARKAIMKRQSEKEKQWRDKFSGTLGIALIYTTHLIRLPMYWQAVRLCFLLDDDGFDLLQITPEEKSRLMDLGDKIAEIKKLAGNMPKVSLPDITIHGEKVLRR